MAKKEFNLSLLEDVATFDTPLKECFDYETILSLIKEEVDIEPTEDELEYQKVEKRCFSPGKGTQRKRSYTSDSVFKSPYKKKCCLKLKSSGSLSTAHKDTPFKCNCNNRRLNKERSLGAVKPKRSFLANQRKYQSSVSHSEASPLSDFGDENVSERPKKILKNAYQEPIVQQNGIEYKHVSSIIEPAVDSSNADDEISISSKGESTSLTTDPLDVEMANDSYVESSQSTQASSELRKRLNRRRNTIDTKTLLSDVLEEDLPNGLVKSEDENENFSLTLSPSSKSSASTIKKEPSMSPLQATNRKSICKASPLKYVMQEDENLCAKGATSASSLRQRRRKISAGSPLKGLTQELESCIRNGDYVEMCDSETESMSFTFETIQLLNDYEDCNQQANNKIFDKILSSPTKPSPEEETPVILHNLITQKNEQFMQDPLHIDYTNQHLPSSTSKQKESTKKYSKRRKTIKDRADEDPLQIDDRDALRDVSSTSTAKKRLNDQEEKGSRECRLNEESLHIDDGNTVEDDSSKSNDKKSKVSKRNLPVRKCRDKTEFSRDEVDENFPYIEDSDTTGGDVSTVSAIENTKKRKRKKEKEKFNQVETSQTDSMSMDNGDPIKDVLSTSTPKMRSKEQKKVSSDSQLNEESVHTIDYSDEMKDYLSKSKEKKCKRNSIGLEKCRKKNQTESSRVELDNKTCRYTDDSDTAENVSSKSATKGKEKKPTKRKSSVGETGKKGKEVSREVKSGEASMSANDEDTEADDLPDTSEPGTSSMKILALDDAEESTPVEKSIRDRRRSGDMSKNGESVNMNSSNLESEQGLAMEAAKLAKMIAAAKKKNAVPDQVYQKMLDLSIKLRHVPPPQHDIKDGLSALRLREEKVFLKHASLNKGKYNTVEDEIIKKNWNDFCQDHDWDPENYKPFLSLKHGKKLIMSCSGERKRFVQFLANGLPNRPLFSVYQRFRRLFDNRYDLYKRYKRREDAKIIAYTTFHLSEPKDKRFVELSQIMRRSNASLWTRNKTLKEKADRVLTRVEWNLSLVEKFIKILLDVTISDELSDLKDALLPRFVWRKIEKKMEIKASILQKYWEQKLHVQLFAPEPILMNEIKIKLIEYMHMNKVKSSRDIRWDDVARYFDGYTIPFLRYVFNLLIIKISRKLKARGFLAMVKFLHNKKIHCLMQKAKDKCLPRISYNDRKAELVAEDMEH